MLATVGDADCALPEVVFFWYDSLRPLREQAPSEVERLWTRKWFAKNEAQAAMDQALLAYEPLMPAAQDELDGAAVADCAAAVEVLRLAAASAAARGSSEPQAPRAGGDTGDVQAAGCGAAAHERILEGQASLLRTLSRVILYDQVSRNIFRRTARAYATDARARSLSRPLLQVLAGQPHAAAAQVLPLHCQITLVMALVHSESAVDQAEASAHVERLTAAYPAHDALLASLRTVGRNHSSRVAMFGRFPERNKFVGRISTEAEQAFLAGIYAA
jgi:uncharacterized protein (DUF924 family)